MSASEGQGVPHCSHGLCCSADVMLAVCLLGWEMVTLPVL